MNLVEIRADLLRKLGIDAPDDATESVDADVLIAINTAGQVLNVAGDPFWLIEAAEVGVSEVIASKVIAGRSVKSVRVKASSSPLLRVDSLWQLQQYAAMFLGQSEPSASYAPQAFHVEMEPTSKAVTVTFGPKPLEAATLSIQFVPTFEAWTLDEISTGDTVPPIPHSYVESIFLPMARYYMTRSHWFNRGDLLPSIEKDFAGVVKLLRGANPALHIPHSDQLKRRKEPTEA